MLCHAGMGQPSFAAGWRWINDETLEIDARRDTAFQNGKSVQREQAGLALYQVFECLTQISCATRW